MFHKHHDLRVQNTKEFIYEAFRILLKRCNYHDITISMIIKKSGVGRTTFYRYFYTKDDIILSKLKSQTLDLVEKLNQMYDLTIYDKDIRKKVRFFFEYWDEHPEIINLIISLDKTQLLYSTWSSLLIDMFTEIEMGLSENISKLYIAHFATGGLTSLLIEWFKNKRKDSVNFITNHFYIPNN